MWCCYIFFFGVEVEKYKEEWILNIWSCGMDGLSWDYKYFFLCKMKILVEEEYS